MRPLWNSRAILRFIPLPLPILPPLCVFRFSLSFSLKWRWYWHYSGSALHPHTLNDTRNNRNAIRSVLQIQIHTHTHPFLNIIVYDCDERVATMGFVVCALVKCMSNRQLNENGSSQFWLASAICRMTLASFWQMIRCDVCVCVCVGPSDCHTFDCRSNNTKAFAI